MATFAIGDVHGCFATLEALAARIGFDRRHDRLWLTGDLVSRGPDSLAVLRWVRDLGERAVVVLGNHDLHLLAVADGVRPLMPRGRLDLILDAPDGDELVAWLASRRLLHREGDRVLVHAGLLPPWSLEEATAVARELEGLLRSAERAPLLDSLGPQPLPGWRHALPLDERRRLGLHAFTRLRACRADGEPLMQFSGPPDEIPDGHAPWFEHPSPRPAETTLLIGHWAAMGFQRRPGLWALDNGCSYGRPLIAVRLDDDEIFHQPHLDGLTS